jgi:hypothetical protein
MGIVTTKEKIQGKLKDRGTVYMFVGYPPNHACEVYRMLNLKIKHIIKSRDILWLNNNFGEWDKKVEEVKNKFDDQDENEDEDFDEVIEESGKFLMYHLMLKKRVRSQNYRMK